MPSSILRGNSQNSLLKKIDTVRRLAGGDPQAAYNQLLESNPKFKKFIEDNQGKTPEQVAQENGLDYSVIMGILGR